MNSPIHFEPEPGARADAPDAMRIPKPALYMAGALIVIVFATAISAKLFGFGAFRETPSVVLAERLLSFSDAADGGILVDDAQTRTVVAHIPPASNGFLRGALRALTRERALAKIGRQQPFRLVRYADGRLVLHDPATKRQVTITSFGPTQIEAFDRLLVVGPAAPLTP